MHLATNRFTTLSALPPSGPVQFFVTVLDEEKREQRLPYASAPWPGDSPAAIGILVPNGTPAEPAGMLYLLPDDPAKHPEHSVRFLNLTSLRIALRAGGVNGDLEPRAEFTVPFDPAEGRLRVDLAIPRAKAGPACLAPTSPSAANTACSPSFARP